MSYLKKNHDNINLISATDRASDGVPFSNLEWLTSEEAAVYLRKTRNAIHLLVSRGFIRPRRLRRKLYFRRIELDRLLESSLSKS